MNNLFGYKKMTDLFSIVMSILMVFISLFHGIAVPVYADELSNVITAASVTDTSGNPITNPIGAWQPFRINVEYKIPSNTAHEGDTTTFTLPEGIVAASPFIFQVKDGNDVISNGKVIDTNPTKVVLTYTSYVEGKSNIEGKFFFNAQISNAVHTTSKEISIDLNENGRIIPAGTVNYQIGQVALQPIIKSGWMWSVDNTVGIYQIKINQENNELINAKVVDELLDPGVQYIPGTLEVFQGKWELVNGGTDVQMPNKETVTDQYIDKITYDGSKFTINIGNLPAGKGLWFRYRVKIQYTPVPGEKFKNKATFTNDGTDYTHSSEYQIINAGGSGEVSKFAIEIKKTDPNGSPIENVIFDVIRVRSGATVGQLKSDANGYAKLGGLLLDDYILREVSTPFGYSPVGDVNVSSTDFDSTTNTATKTIVNLPSKTSISVTKQWIGKAANSVTVHLYADGVKIDSKQLTPANQWQHTFANLNKYNNGNEIQYTVKEDMIANYDSSVTGDMTTGFKITNTNTEKVTIPIEKKWVGLAAASVTVKLMADGVEKASIVLNADHNWKYTFSNLSKYDAKDGHEIAYTVQEEQVAGYTTAISGTTTTGFTITNTKITNTLNKPAGSPKTSDTTNIILYESILLTSLFMLFTLVLTKRKFRVQK